MQNPNYLGQLNAAAQQMFNSPGGAPAGTPGGISPQVLQYQSQVQSLVSEMQLELRQNEADAAALSDKISSQTSEIEQLRSSVSTLTTQVADGNTKILLAGTELNTKLAEKETEHKPVVDELAALKTKVEELTAQVTDLTAKLTTAETELAAVKKTAGKQGAEALGLPKAGETTSEKGESTAEAEELTADEAQANAAAAVVGADGKPKALSSEAIHVEYLKRQQDANVYGGAKIREFQDWYQENQVAVQRALRG